MRDNIHIDYSILQRIKDPTARARIAGAITPCSGVTCTAALPPVIEADHDEKGNMIRAFVRCPQCGNTSKPYEYRGSVFNTLYNAAVTWTQEQKNLKPHRLYEQNYKWW